MHSAQCAFVYTSRQLKICEHYFWPDQLSLKFAGRIKERIVEDKRQLNEVWIWRLCRRQVTSALSGSPGWAHVHTASCKLIIVIVYGSSMSALTNVEQVDLPGNVKEWNYVVFIYLKKMSDNELSRPGHVVCIAARRKWWVVLILNGKNTGPLTFCNRAQNNASQTLLIGVVGFQIFISFYPSSCSDCS